MRNQAMQDSVLVLVTLGCVKWPLRVKAKFNIPSWAVHLNALESCPYFIFFQNSTACWPGKIIEHMVFISFLRAYRQDKKSEDLLAVSSSFLSSYFIYQELIKKPEVLNSQVLFFFWALVFDLFLDLNSPPPPCSFYCWMCHCEPPS